jgi:hypothetical protein
MAIVALNCREALEQPFNRESRDPEKAQQAAAVNRETREYSLSPKIFIVFLPEK